MAGGRRRPAGRLGVAPPGMETGEFRVHLYGYSLGEGQRDRLLLSVDKDDLDDDATLADIERAVTEMTY